MLRKVRKRVIFVAWGNKIDKMPVAVEGKLDENGWNVPVELILQR